MEMYINIAYLIAAVCFIYGLKMLSHPRTARNGNFISSFGMFIAVIATLTIGLESGTLQLDWTMIGIAIAIGSVIGAFFAIKVEMTQMPQLVAIFNGFGGGASALVACAEFGSSTETFTLIAIALSIVVGTLTFTGSFIAFGKLQGFVSGQPITFGGQQPLNALLAILVITSSIFMIMKDDYVDSKNLPNNSIYLNDSGELLYNTANDFSMFQIEVHGDSDFEVFGGESEENKFYIASTKINNYESVIIEGVTSGKKIPKGKGILLKIKSDNNIKINGIGILLDETKGITPDNAKSLSYFVPKNNDYINNSDIAFYVLIGLAALLGILLVIPIGGADMPVVISLLNSYSGVAAAMTGFVLVFAGNTSAGNALIICGSLVGASGIILTKIMCKGMNRSLANVIFGAVGGEIEGGATGSGKEVNIKSYSTEEAAMIFDAAEKIIIVPGYGLAVAQAQHGVRELAEHLESMGKTVLYAIHPVAGRMPGHMNVLLAEANVPYEQLKDLDEINPEFEDCDVALVLGANDVVNPAARTDQSSPIFGMPILNVDKSRTVIINKRTMNTGFAGIQNELFGYDNSIMVFGDAKDMLTQLLSDIKEL